MFSILLVSLHTETHNEANYKDDNHELGNNLQSLIGDSQNLILNLRDAFRTFGIEPSGFLIILNFPTNESLNLSIIC